MITFKEFLTESDHKPSLDAAEAIRLINTHCRDALRNKQMIYRGMTNNGEQAFAIHGEAGGRSSKNTRNYYTVILDHFLPRDGYPKRSKSVICANDKYTARGFGTAYMLFPYDGVKIGVCDTSDLWFSPTFKVGNADEEMRIDSWNAVWAEYGLSSNSYEDFVASIKNKMRRGSVGPDSENTARMLRVIFGDEDNIEPALEKAYNPKTLGMHLATPDTIDEYRNRERELWISGKCIAILPGVFEKMQKDDHDDELAPED